MELCSIASGSSGNCICVGSDDCHVLIDAGISGKRIENGLNSIDLKTADMQGILITHEHIDHIAGLGVIARRYGIPMYATGETVDAILHTKTVGKIDEALFQVIEPEREFTIGDLTIEPVSISHDAADPVAYKIRQQEKNVAVMTDLGTYDDHIVEKLQNVDVLLLEANHDVRMLQAGAYPYPLKQRILVMASAYLQIEQAKNFINLRIRGVLCIFYKLSKNFWNNWKIIGILLISKILIATVIVEEINNTILSYAF